MRISVIGCGYLGTVHAVSMAELGHEVVGIDIDRTKIGQLAAGFPPLFEPGVSELLSTGISNGRLSFSDEFTAAKGACVHFITVGTPQIEGGFAADVNFVDAAVGALLPNLRPGDLVVGKSTVPVGTAERLADLIERETVGVALLWNPEFLREGHGLADTLAPDRLVYGVRAGEAGERAVAILDQVYARALALGTPRIVTDYATTELVKVSANAFLATKISFINAIAEIAEATGADVTQLAAAIGLDERIGPRFLNSGLGFGGGCLPKDIRGFRARAEELGLEKSLAFLGEVEAINLRRRDRMIDLTKEVLNDSLEGRRVAVLGLAFKPNSDDVRDSPALDVAARLAAQGAVVTATDPKAVDSSRRLYPDLDYAGSPQEAVIGADVVLMLTEWPEYCELQPEALSAVASTIMLDGRNCLDRAVWEDAGWMYRGLGRP